MDAKKEHGIHAHNQEYAHYDQVDKARDYRLAEQEGKETFDEDFRIRTCDLGRYLHGNTEDRARFARELGEAMEEIGFAILVGHGVDSALHREAFDWTEEFFDSTTLEQKLAYRAARHGSVSQGYFPLEETSDIHPDLVEGWVFCRRAFDLEPVSAPRMEAEPGLRVEDFWPRPEFEPRFRRLVTAQLPLFRPIMSAILQYLGCDPSLYDARMASANFGLRLNYYPPLTSESETRGAGRLLGHEDVDLFTLLPAPRVEGLQVLSRQNKWVRLQAPPDSIILNTGDYMQLLSNDILPSTTHRVGRPRDPDELRRVRTTFPMAAYLWEQEVLQVLPGLGEPRYAPIEAIRFHTRTTAKFYGDDYAVDSE